MTETVTLTVAGTPVPKGRPRSTRTGRHYTPEATKVAESQVLAVWITTAGLDRQPHPGPVEVELVATFTPPASWPKWKRSAALAGDWPHTVKPDGDNLLKLVKDALNGHAYLDDSQAFRVGARKQYGPTASTTVALTFHPSPSKSNQTQKEQ